MRRNPNATLSPTELASLRHVSNGLANTVPDRHRDLFITMGLVTADDIGGLVVTEVGQRRLRQSGDREPRRVTSEINLLDGPSSK